MSRNISNRSEIEAGFNRYKFNYFKQIKSVPRGNRTPVAGVKGQCPRPLDDGDTMWAVQDLNLRLSA